MRGHFLLILILLFAVGCNTAPRYRTGSASRPAEETRKKTTTKPKSQKSDKQVYTNSSRSPGMTTAQLMKLGDVINRYLGKPYKGSYKNSDGVDCSQLVMEIFSKFNRTKLPRTAANQYKSGRKVNREHLRYGDLVFFNTTGRKISHVGIFVENDQFVHASSSKGVIISKMSEEYWHKRFVGSRRIIE